MTAPARQRLPVVAIVGRPNVGKSSLVNRILGRREAIVQQMPGVTRDRRSFTADWAGRSFEIVDTGGLEPGAEGLEARVVEQANVAIEAADVIVLVVDASAGPLEDDVLVAQILRRSDKPVLVAANKVDDPRDEPEAAAFFRLGLGEPVPFSALHGRGSGDLLSTLVGLLPDAAGEAATEWASVAIVGRPNVGKSSLLNALLGEHRAIVDAMPGTTRDPVDSIIELDEARRVRLVDTAGMRRQVRIDDPIEYFSFLRSRNTLGRVDVAILVVDASEGVTGHDQRIAEEILEAGRACVIALNKWDLVTGEESDRRRFEADVRTKLRFVDWARTLRISALTRKGIHRVLPATAAAVDAHRTRLETALVNRMVTAAQDRRPHPRTGGRLVRILYSVQAGISPPTFVFFSSRRLHREYLRYLEHQIRADEPFEGSPLRMEQRVRSRHKV